MNKDLFVDLHIHIGRSSEGHPVKIAASAQLTLPHILHESIHQKGLDVIGIVDAASPPVLHDIHRLIDEGALTPLPGGGLQYVENGRTLTLILGVEAGAASGGGEAHYLSYFPHVHNVEGFSQSLSQFVTNVTLSSQKTRLTPAELLAMTTDHGGTFVLAHAFTPHKGYYGISAPALAHAFPDDVRQHVAGIELGLSADTLMASAISDTDGLAFLSNSDAHSTGNIAREYMQFQGCDGDFTSIFDALMARPNADGRLVANYGLLPALGKYHRTFCNECEALIELLPDRHCPRCNGRKMTVGVADRVDEIADRDGSTVIDDRPPYVHQIPLRFVPGIGPKTYRRLLDAFETEMNVLHRVSDDELRAQLPEKIATAIVKSREGRWAVAEGGGGQYGKLTSG